MLTTALTTMPTTRKKLCRMKVATASLSRLTSPCARTATRMISRTGTRLAKYLLKPYDSAVPTCGPAGGPPYEGGGGGGGGGGGTSDTFAPQLELQNANASPGRR